MKYYCFTSAERVHIFLSEISMHSDYSVIVNPTYYVGDESWLSDTKPSPAILAHIRERKK